jgi:hypothetical protein
VDDQNWWTVYRPGQARRPVARLQRTTTAVAGFGERRNGNDWLRAGRARSHWPNWPQRHRPRCSPPPPFSPKADVPSDGRPRPIAVAPRRREESRQIVTPGAVVHRALPAR